MLGLRRIRILVFGVAAVAALGLATILVPAAAGGNNRLARFIHPGLVITSPIVYQGSFGSGVATLEADDTGSGYGLIGTANSAPGVFGTSNTGVGLVGLSTNSFGINGSSINNIGLNGFSQNATGVGGSGPNATYNNAGVFGASGSTSTSLSPVGVYGQIPVTGFGVVGECVNNSAGNPTNLTDCHAVFGQTLGTQGIALEGFTQNGPPAPNYTPLPVLVLENFTGGPLLTSFTSAGTPDVIDGNGQLIITPGNNVRAIETDASGTGGDSIDAFTEAANAGQALIGQSNGVGVTAEGWATATNPALVVRSELGAPEIIASSGSGDVMSLDASGNLITKGTITASGSPLISTRTSTGTKVTTYAPQASQPIVEDFGQGQLVNGSADVRVDPAFASTMNQRAGYLVFLTPLGESRGWLYVTQKSATGFRVREAQGGRSTIAFDYRIVGKPYGSVAARLPVANELGPDPTAIAEHARSLERRRADLGALMHRSRIVPDRPVGKPHGLIKQPY